RERLVVDGILRLQHSVAESERFLLPDRDEIHHRTDRLDLAEEIVLLALLQRPLQLRRAIEMIEDGVFPLRHDDDQLVESRSERLLDSILQNRLVDERQHLLRNDFRRRKEARAESGAGEDASAKGGHGWRITV